MKRLPGTRKICRISAVVLLGLLLYALGSAAVPAVQMQGRGEDILSSYRETVRESEYMRHALGGLAQECAYTNSREALEESYARGFRLFETDVRLTRDGVPVLVHSWKKSDYESKIGMANYRAKEAGENGKYVPSYEEFCAFSIQGRYTPLSFADLLDFMREHTDMYVLIDTGGQSYENTLAIYGALAAAAEGECALLDRLIAGGHTKAMIRAVKEVYAFPLLNLYFARPEKRCEAWKEPAGFIRYCKKAGITSFSVAADVYTEEIAEAFRGAGLICYVFTVNDEKEAVRLREAGADVIGTDFLQE